MRAGHTDCAHDTGVVDDALLGADSVFSTLIDCDIVVGTEYAVVDHVSHDEVEVSETIGDRESVGVVVEAHALELLAQIDDFAFKQRVALVEVVVCLAEGEVRGDVVGSGI